MKSRSDTNNGRTSVLPSTNTVGQHCSADTIIAQGVEEPAQEEYARIQSTLSSTSYGIIV